MYIIQCRNKYLRILTHLNKYGEHTYIFKLMIYSYILSMIYKYNINIQDD